MSDRIAQESPDQHMVALTFFDSLHKEAASIREIARSSLRATTKTNSLPSLAKGSTVKPLEEVAAVKAVKSQLTSKLKKQAFVEGLIRNAAHHAASIPGKVGPASEAAGTLIGKLRSKLHGAMEPIRDSKEGFKTGFNTKKQGPASVISEKLETLLGDHKAGKNWSNTAGEMLRGGSEKVVGSERHYEHLVRTKGRRYADAYRMGMGARGTVDPHTASNVARHFSDSKGNINPLTVFSGLHSSGMVSPETTKGLAGRMVRRKPKEFSLDSMTPTQKVIGGASLGGLGYLALRKRAKPEHSELS